MWHRYPSMECQWLRYDFDNTQVYKETDGAVSPFQITAVAWAGYQLTADHALKDVIGRISRNETGKLTVHYVCPELQEFFDELKKYPAISGERTIPYFIFHGGDIAKLAYATNEFLYYEDSNYMPLMFRTIDGTLVSDNEFADNFIRNTQVKAMTSIWTAKQKARELADRTAEALTDRTGQGTLDVAITVLISIVLGALILAGLYLIVDDTVLPTITQRIKDMFNYGG